MQTAVISSYERKVLQCEKWHARDRQLVKDFLKYLDDLGKRLDSYAN